MLKKFQKHKNKILILAVWLSLFRANFSLAKEYLFNEDDYRSSILRAERIEIIMSITNWFLYLIGIIGLFCMVISCILFIIDFFKKKQAIHDKIANTLVEYKKLSPMVEHKKSGSMKLFILSLILFGFCFLGYYTRAYFNYTLNPSW